MKIEYSMVWFESNADKFDIWYDPTKFPHEYSWALAYYCYKDFDKWFDPDTFFWDQRYGLVECCIEHIDKWYDPEQFHESYEELLIMSIK
tara:strand:+ start:2808 stop:3077 length:270 start_codon:yes stop_codon:yes gene_type:complete